MITETQPQKERIVLLDIIRIVCALLIYGRHSISMMKCTYGHMLDGLISYLTGAVMTCFFMISGFSLYYAYSEKTVQSAEELLSFYKKRVVAILPSYYLIHVLWLCFHTDQLKEWAILTPVEVTGTQSYYYNLFGVLHNGGTWFISCLLICYLVYPIIHTLFSNLIVSKVCFVMVISYFLLIYSYIIVGHFGLADNYANPFFRGLEFVIGTGMAAVFEKTRQKLPDKEKKIIIVLMVISGGFVLVTNNYIIVSFLVRLNVFIPIPCILILLFLATRIKLKENRVITFFSGISYHVFLIQMVLWNICAIVLKALHLSRNRWRILISLFLCIGGACAMSRFFDRPIRKWFNGYKKKTGTY